MTPEFIRKLKIGIAASVIEHQAIEREHRIKDIERDIGKFSLENDIRQRARIWRDRMEAEQIRRIVASLYRLGGLNDHQIEWLKKIRRLPQRL